MPMDSYSRLSQHSCVNLHTGTMISLWVTLFTSIIFVFQVAIGTLFRNFGSEGTGGRILGMLLLWLTFECAPVVVGLCGLCQKNPACLKVPVLFVLIHTGIVFRGHIMMYASSRASDEVIEINSFKIEFARLVMLWFFAFTWYQYALALKRGPRGGQNIPFRDVESGVVNNNAPQPGAG